MSYDRVITYRPDTAANWATNNPVLSQGEGAIETDTGAVKIGNGTSAYNSLEYRQQLPYTYDLTSASATHTFPTITGKPQVEEVYWTNGGTYTLTFAVSNLETIDGLPAATWTGEGEGHIIVVSDGTNWQVAEYRDFNSGTGTGLTGYWEKHADGTLKQWGTYSFAEDITAVGYGGYIQSVNVALFKTFIDSSYTMSAFGRYAVSYIHRGDSTTTSAHFYAWRPNSESGNTEIMFWVTTGRWRT